MTAALNLNQAELDLEDIKFLPIATVCEITGAGKTFIYNEIREGRFPKPVKYGRQISRWVDTEVQAWMRKQMACR